MFLDLVGPPIGQVGLVGDVVLLEVITLRLRVVALAKILDRRVQFLDPVGQLGEYLKVGLRFAQRLDTQIVA